MSDIRDQQLQEVLNYFNLTVTETNVFSRCLRCNGSEFLFVTQTEMSEMTRIPLVTQAPHSHDTFLNDQKARSWTLRKCYLKSSNQSDANFFTVTGKLTACCKQKRITSNGIPIQLSLIKKETLHIYPSFYVCEVRLILITAKNITLFKK